MKLILLILILIHQIFAQSNQICSSSCASHVGACKNFTYNGCIVCDYDLFNQIPNASGCVTKPQVNIEAVDLKNPIDLTSFTLSTYATYTCGGF